MTTEEKAKAYDEALEKAKKYHEEYWQVDAKDITETLFPQLRESEDERIRTEIISALEFANDGGIYDKHIAYLEKQKEQKPAEWSEEDERMLSRCEKSIESSKQFADSDTFKKAKDNEIDWLENRFKSLCPSWKPSEEQMEALKGALETYKGYEEYDAIKSLYNDLKKL